LANSPPKASPPQVGVEARLFISMLTHVNAGPSTFDL
jgi:hypothetical protein